MFEYRPLPGLLLRYRQRWQVWKLVLLAAVLLFALYWLYRTPELAHLPTPQRTLSNPPARSLRTAHHPQLHGTPKYQQPVTQRHLRRIPTRYRRKVSKAMKRRIAARDGYRCVDCGLWCPDIGHVDHIEPLFNDPWGCRTAYLNSEQNLAFRCPNCHAVKSNLDVDKFRISSN